MTEVEAASLLSRLRYMQKVGVLSEKVKYGQKNIDSSSSEGVSARQGRPSLPLGFIGA